MSDNSNAPRKSGTRLLVMLVGVAAAAGLGVLLQRQLSKPAPVQAAAVPAAAAPEADAEADAAVAVAAPTVPEVLPQFELMDREGSAVARRLKVSADRQLLGDMGRPECGNPLLSQLRSRSKPEAEVLASPWTSARTC